MTLPPNSAGAKVWLPQSQGQRRKENGRAHPGPWCSRSAALASSCSCLGPGLWDWSNDSWFRRLPDVATAATLSSASSGGRTRSLVGHRHHRASDPGGKGLLRRCARLLQTAGGWVGRSTPRRQPPWWPTPRHGDGPVGARRRRDHSDQDTQFTSWAFTRRALDSGLPPSMGSAGSCFDNPLIESIWRRMQVKLLDRRGRRTRVELANATFEYPEIFYNPPAPTLGVGHAYTSRVRDSAPDRDGGLESDNSTPPNLGQLRLSNEPRVVQFSSRALGDAPESGCS